MKTKEEIKNWLFSRPWFSEYVEEMMQGKRPETVVSFLRGEHGETTISGAFGWAAAGNWELWNSRNEAFEQWLKSVTFDAIKEGQQFYYDDKRYIKVGDVTALEVKRTIRFSETCEVMTI